MEIATAGKAFDVGFSHGQLLTNHGGHRVLAGLGSKGCPGRTQNKGEVLPDPYPACLVSLSNRQVFPGFKDNKTRGISICENCPWPDSAPDPKAGAQAALSQSDPLPRERKTWHPINQRDQRGLQEAGFGFSCRNAMAKGRKGHTV